MHTVTRVACHAGPSPNTNPVAIDTAAANRKTGQLKLATNAGGVHEFAIMRGSTFLIAHASSNPATPPITESSKLSVIHCRKIIHRPAPSARRTLISRCRAPTRASSRFARLAQASSNTNPESAISTTTARQPPEGDLLSGRGSIF